MQKLNELILLFKFTILFLNLFVSTLAYGVLAGGRPNSISGGTNAFAGVVNPANAVWIEDRLDLGAFIHHQKSSINNRDNNPLFLPGKTDLTYRTKYLFTGDMAIHKQIQLCAYTASLSLASYATPSEVKLRTKRPIPANGTTPLFIYNKIQAISCVLSFKLNPRHSFGLSIDYFYLSHNRKGFQRADNQIRSVSPGHVTNNGVAHSNGIGLSAGWRWNITKTLTFGIAWVKKSYVGQFRRYRGYEPHHARNYIPDTLGAGFNYRFNTRIAGRLEVLWTDLSRLPNANNNLLSNGKLNLNKRGSSKSPGPGLQDALYINMGIGCQVNPMLSLGAGFSHRIKWKTSTNIIISHSYRLQTIYDILSFGAEIKCQKHEVFLSFAYGFNNQVRGVLPNEIGGGRVISEKNTASLSVAWGYKY